jgi:subtilisin family serine protease
MDGDHPEFTGKILGGKNYIGEGTFKTDSYIHGTHVAGIIGGLGDASHGKGMAPAVKFFSYKALGPQGGSQSGIMEGMDQAVKDKCQIINMSLGRVGGEESKSGNPYYAVIKRIVDANVIVVAQEARVFLGLRDHQEL